MFCFYLVLYKLYGVSVKLILLLFAYLASLLDWIKQQLVSDIFNILNLLFFIVFQHTSCLCDAVIALLKVPLSFQRYFFQKLQSTSIKVTDFTIGAVQKPKYENKKLWLYGGMC